METIARACHELRGPLTAVRLGLEGGAANGMLTSDRLRAIDLELGRAALVLDDLDAVRTRRTWSRLPEPIDLEQLVSDSVEEAGVAPGRRRARSQLRASWSGDARTVWGDRLRLAQVTGNLIANAIEHGGGVVEVHGHGDHTRARVEVSDSGPGLPAPVAELVRAGSRGRGGRRRRGRGLAIAAAVAADQGGRLAVAPSVRGARVVLELPAGRVVAEQGPGRRSLTGSESAGSVAAVGGDGHGRLVRVSGVARGRRRGLPVSAAGGGCRRRPWVTAAAGVGLARVRRLRVARRCSRWLAPNRAGAASAGAPRDRRSLRPGLFRRRAGQAGAPLRPASLNPVREQRPHVFRSKAPCCVQPSADKHVGDAYPRSADAGDPLWRLLQGDGPMQGRVVGAAARDPAGAARYLVGAMPLARAASSPHRQRRLWRPDTRRHQPLAPNPEP